MNTTIKNTMQESPDEVAPIKVEQYNGRVFVLIETLNPKAVGLQHQYRCKKISKEEAIEAHVKYADIEKFQVVAVPDIYSQALENDALKCMDYMGYFETMAKNSQKK